MVEADAAQMQQLIMNLVINGAEAIGPAQGFTEVATSTQAVALGETFNSVMGDRIPPGDYVVLAVTDNGRGMDAATRARIFDPFFTTKFTGRGLGLAAVLGIVKGHGGGIQVDSTPGKGTTFRVFLAASQATAEAESQPAVLPGSPSVPAFGKVLVADDEEVVLRVAKAVLEREGYQVLLARNGAEAVEALRGQPAEIGIILLDMTMPVMTGEEALPKLKAIRKDVRVIASSGYNEIEALRRFGGSIQGFLQKPYTAKQLNDKVKAALT
jgi:CheY-like chemotaxis protein